MPECDYCGESVDGEDAYLDHLATTHEGELGSIDRRRVEAHREGDGDGGGLALGPTVLGTLLVLAVALVVWVTFFMGGGGSTNPSGPSDGGVREIPDDPLLSEAESFESNGREHVSPGTDIQYERVPPLSGTHYADWSGAGFYEQTPPLGGVVHSLEHGYVVIYYDPAAITSDARSDLESLASTYTERWESVIVAPYPGDDPPAAYELTAWQVRLRMDEYDAEKVRAFLDAFRGRGPENPVR